MFQMLSQTIRNELNRFWQSILQRKYPSTKESYGVRVKVLKNKIIHLFI